jgi:preprotein translocase SecF subunit
MRHLHLVPQNTKIDFVKWRWFGFGVTALTMVITVAAIWLQGFNLGIDFTGGVTIDAQQTTGPVDVGAVRDKFAAIGYGDATIQTYGEAAGELPTKVAIRLKPNEATAGNENAIVEQAKAALGPDFKLLKSETVGPKISEELFNNGMLACLLAILVVAVYVALRFEWQFGVAAFIATFHDVIVTAGFFAVTQLDFDLNAVAALLTLAGYSVNDTVIIFDRIRENRRKYKRMPLAELINLSTNQTLPRTLMTSICVALSVIPLVIFGGDALYGFSVAILFGVVVGTYSSIYVASALLLYMPPIGSMEKAAPPPGEGRAARP